MCFSLQIDKPNVKSSSSNQPCLEPVKFADTPDDQKWILAKFQVIGFKPHINGKQIQAAYAHNWTFKLNMVETQYTIWGWFLTPMVPVIRGWLSIGFTTVWTIINNYHRSLQWPATNAEPNRSEQPIHPYACLSSQLVVGQNHPCCSHPKHIARMVLVKMLFTASYTMKKGRHRFLFNNYTRKITRWYTIRICQLHHSYTIAIPSVYG